MPPLILVGRPALTPAASDQEMTFQTFRTYLMATIAWAEALYPHPGRVLPGVAEAVKARTAASWRSADSLRRLVAICWAAHRVAVARIADRRAGCHPHPERRGV